jgi:hypothetical protein
VPRVVGGPYEFGVPGARHAILSDEEGEPEVEKGAQPAVAGAKAGGGT